jgi:hypothetical protein
MHIVSCQKIVAEWFLLNVPAMVLGWFFAGGLIGRVGVLCLVTPGFVSLRPPEKSGQAGLLHCAHFGACVCCVRNPVSV